MRVSLIAALLLGASLAACAQVLPLLTAVDPTSGKKGDIIAVSGANLERAQVEKVFLTDGKNDIAVEVTEQTATSLKFKIPDSAAPGGRLSVMILTAGKDAKYIEEPVKVMIEP